MGCMVEIRQVLSSYHKSSRVVALWLIRCFIYLHKGTEAAAQ